MADVDELFIDSPKRVHIERMGDALMWVGVETHDGKSFLINTGIQDGKWFFSVEMEGEGGFFASNDFPVKAESAR